MSSTARRPLWRTYWPLVAFVALVLAPPSWTTVALSVAITATVMLRSARMVVARRRARASERAGSTLLGTSRKGKKLQLTDRQQSAHGLIVGASGAGKSTTLLTILTDHVRRGNPVVAIDLKGSPAFERALSEAAAAAGRPFRLWTPDGPGHWNPLAHGNATELKDKLVATERFTEPHYQRAAERYVQTALQVLHQVRPDRAPTLEEVVQLMDPRRMPRMLRAVPRELASRVQDYLAELTHDQLSAIRGLGTRLAIVTESQAGRYLVPGQPSGSAQWGPRQSSPAVEEGSADPPAQPPIDVRAAVSGPEVVLFSLNSSTYGKLGAQIGTLVIQDLVSAAGDRLKDPARIAATGQAVVGIDEFSALGGDQLVALLARGREAGVSVFLATQELVDLDRAAHGLRDQVLGNTAIKIAHRQDVPSSAQTVAQMAGTETVWEETHQLGGRWFGGYESGRGTRREVERFVVHPNEIRTLRTGEAVVITKLPQTNVQVVQVAPPRAVGREEETGAPARAAGRDQGTPGSPFAQGSSARQPAGPAPVRAPPLLSAEEPTPSRGRGQASPAANGQSAPRGAGREGPELG